jgi:Transposase and inactivated derivatives
MTWVARYRAEGIQGLIPAESNKYYPEQLKISAVKEYLSGSCSQLAICEKYSIRSRIALQRWIKQYNSHEAMKGFTGGSHMTKGRETTKEERIQLVQECIAKGNNYGAIALKYQVSYQQIYTWVKKYQEKGEDGLSDCRGRKVLPKEPETEEERLRRENAELKRKLYYSEMENACLKKLDEIERRLRH